MTRAFLVVLDSVGCGGAPDAEAFGDPGANTLGHIIEACAAGEAEEGRSGPLKVPNLDSLGLGAAVRLASDVATPGLDAAPHGYWGAATETSPGKDTPTGHWEIAGVPVPWDWHYFPNTDPTFPLHITEALCRFAGTKGILGNRHASGTGIIEEEGQRHIETGWPICYTSVDSVLQIAAHEEHFGLDRLLQLCRDVAPLLHEMKVGRVIARPFVGDCEAGFVRTTNRKDFAVEPPEATICDLVHRSGSKVYAIGKIGDIFSMRGIDELRKGADSELMQHLADFVDSADEGSLTFANFVEFDTQYGHRRDVSGYARALEWFDAQLPNLFAKMRDGDIMIFTADHGNDPTYRGTDHTRERVPVVIHGLGAGEVGHCGFADIGASISTYLNVSRPGAGKSFLP
ncbi:phosphopentomutase [Cochlodiniinecator piscidefendens]|uniref:phosphopentomutase n=1 Tax=Cochlodiniinecator piscidefendens TaxID=2715756 RepID=UPI001407802D|nr:phosphopentomutase [Cochlodiniinecator piscidefendens]